MKAEFRPAYVDLDHAMVAYDLTQRLAEGSRCRCEAAGIPGLNLMWDPVA